MITAVGVGRPVQNGLAKIAGSAIVPRVGLALPGSALLPAFSALRTAAGHAALLALTGIAARIPAGAGLLVGRIGFQLALIVTCHIESPRFGCQRLSKSHRMRDATRVDKTKVSHSIQLSSQLSRKLEEKIFDHDSWHGDHAEELAMGARQPLVEEKRR
jgi:hypothetical protein